MDGDGRQWEGKAQAHLSSSPDQAWSLLSQFSNHHTLLPSITTCRLIEGVDGQPGCVRYCASPPIPTGDGGQTTFWAKERLLSIDHVGRRIKYEVVESNMGFGKYVGSMAAVEIGDGGGGGCVLEWAFEAAPVVGMSRDGLLRYLENGIGYAARMIDESAKGGEEDAKAKLTTLSELL